MTTQTRDAGVNATLPGQFQREGQTMTPRLSGESGPAPASLPYVDELTPAQFSVEATAAAHASWCWAFRIDAIACTRALQRLTDAQLRDVDLAANLYVRLIEAEQGRRDTAAMVSALLTPDAEVTS